MRCAQPIGLRNDYMGRVIFVFIVLLKSFTGKGQEVIRFERFPAEKTLEENIIGSFSGPAPSGMLLLNDSVALLRNATGSGVKHFTSWNLNQKKASGNILPVGSKIGQSFNFLSFGVRHGSLWVYDILKDKIIIQRLNGSASGSFYGEFTLQPFYYSADLLNDSTLIATGNYDGDYKVYVVDVLHNRKTDSLIRYERLGEKALLREEKMAYESFLVAKPSGEKCALASRYSDRIEIIDLSSKTSKVVSGPEGFLPDVMYARGNDGKMLSTRNENTRYAFLKAKVTDHYIYLLYSGHNHLSEHLHYGNSIYVFDWNGNPIQKLEFKQDLVDFAVSEDDKRLYAIRPDKSVITEASVRSF